MAKAKEEKKETFEVSMARLEEIVGRLSDGKLPLGDMIALYEEGAGIAARCRATLDEYSARLDKIDRLAEDGAVK